MFNLAHRKSANNCISFDVFNRFSFFKYIYLVDFWLIKAPKLTQQRDWDLRARRATDSYGNPLHNFPLNPMERMWGLVQQWSKSLRFHTVAAANLRLSNAATSLTPLRKHKGQCPAQTDILANEWKTKCAVLHFTYETCCQTEISYTIFSP